MVRQTFPDAAFYDLLEADTLPALAEEVALSRKIVVCNEKLRRKADDGTEILPAAVFFEELWSGGLLGK